MERYLGMVRAVAGWPGSLLVLATCYPWQATPFGAKCRAAAWKKATMLLTFSLALRVARVNMCLPTASGPGGCYMVAPSTARSGTCPAPQWPGSRSRDHRPAAAKHVASRVWS